MRRVYQEPGYCGPASLEMMLSFFGENITQHMIADVIGGIPIEEEGSRLDQLSEAVEKLAPDYLLLAKYNSSISDLVLLTSFGLPVCVEWQAEFKQSDGRYITEGHYSIVLDVNIHDKTLTILDPDKRSTLRNEQISFAKFARRWWDTNNIPGLEAASSFEIVKHEGLLFIITTKEDIGFFRSIGLERATLTLMHKFKVPLS